MKQMHINVVIPTAEISELLNSWFEENLPADIRIRRGVRKGQKVVCFSIYGTSQEDIIDKWNALDTLLERHKNVEKQKS